MIYTLESADLAKDQGLTLSKLNKFLTDDMLKLILLFFSDKTRQREMIHMKCQAVFFSEK